MEKLTEMLAYIQSLEEKMLSHLMLFSEVNTGSGNYGGLEQAASILHGRLVSTADTVETVRLATPCGFLPMLIAKKRAEAPLQALMTGHFDTVFPPESLFQKSERNSKLNRLKGPGVADMKAGIVIMLTALEAFEKYKTSNNLGWTVALNADEELGSPYSSTLLADLAGTHHIGLVFEPSLPDGTLVGSRKGSATLTLYFQGRSAHAGRCFHEGASAIYAMAEAVRAIEKLNKKRLTVNTGIISGGTAANIVPEQAFCRINIRAEQHKILTEAIEQIQIICQKTKNGVEATMKIDGLRPPKPLDKQTRSLFQFIRKTGRKLGIELQWAPSGGVCDGNTLSAAGLATVDTLGAIGGGLHTENEYIEIGSLVERASLTAGCLRVLETKTRNQLVKLYGRSS